MLQESSPSSLTSPSSPPLASPFQPSDRLPLRTNRRKSLAAVPQGVYLGLELDYCGNGKINYAICAHDGCYIIDYELSSVDVSDISEPHDRVEKVIQVVLDNIILYSKAQNYKIQAIGLGAQDESNEDEDMKKILHASPSLASRLWLEFDALPFIINTRGSTVDERASSAVRKIVVWYIYIFLYIFFNRIIRILF